MDQSSSTGSSSAMCATIACSLTLLLEDNLTTFICYAQLRAVLSELASACRLHLLAS